jgi:hypothetical protein
MREPYITEQKSEISKFEYSLYNVLLVAIFEIQLKACSIIDGQDFLHISNKDNGVRKENQRMLFI